MTAASTTETGTAAREEAEPFRLAVAGMSCASCVAHVEKSLNGIDGVRATVNLATEQASGSPPASTSGIDDPGPASARRTSPSRPSSPPSRRPATRRGPSPASTRTTTTTSRSVC